WRHPGNGANLVILTRREFFASLDPLVSLRQKQGYSIAVIDIEDIYDEFSYGQKTPRAVKDFLTYAATNWKKAPRFVMLAGDASFDPKNYLGFGDSDLIPTKLIDTQYMETASDDWLVDFNGDGLPDMSIGRLPVRSSDEALRLATKIAGYDRQQSTRRLLLVSDQNDSFDFEAASNILRGLIPRNIRIESVERAHVDDATAKARLIDAINRGQIIVNYTGHGSVNQWRGNLLTSADAFGLTNTRDLSMFVMMTCLNGFFQDAALDSLAESLLKANGGAVAAWGSSGMTTPDIQAILNQQVYRMIFDGKPITIGEATARAKAAVTDGDVRRTWILLGDPTTRLSR
ncbi:MAG TPA: C25 family cysteine peptidase, partial [Blastocatellia bacterium]|nr:C25 family cysteine peptidase [Blastocatellia bacterium]